MKALSHNVLRQIPPGQKSFRPALTEVSALKAQLEETQERIDSNQDAADLDHGQLQDFKETTEKTLQQLQELLADWREWDNERQQRWLAAEGKDELTKIVLQLQSNSDQLIGFQLAIKSYGDH